MRKTHFNQVFSPIVVKEQEEYDKYVIVAVDLENCVWVSENGKEFTLLESKE